MQLHNKVQPCSQSPSKEETASADSQYDAVMKALHFDAKWSEEVNLGCRVGLYRVRGEIGTGNFSRVKLAVHELTKENVAIKIVDKGRLDEKTRRMLQQEIDALERVHHPNIIRLYEVLETYSKMYLAMEYARGGELFNKITTTGRYEEPMAKVIFAQICSAVQHLHEKLIVHRDIKAENVFLSSANRVKLGDFGFSVQVSSAEEQLNMFCGSPPYAAPELFRDDQYLGRPVDVWALGVLLYFLVVGRMPFRGHNVPTIKSHILAGTFVLPRFLSKELSALIERMLNQVPSERPSAAEILASDWLSGMPALLPHENDQSYILQPTVLPYKHSAEKIENENYSIIEKTARERLECLGISDALLGSHASQGSRSHIIGCYRIVVHRVERQLSSFSDLDRILPTVVAKNQSAARQDVCLACCWGKQRRKDGDRSQCCSIF